MRIMSEKKAVAKNFQIGIFLICGILVLADHDTADQNNEEYLPQRDFTKIGGNIEEKEELANNNFKKPGDRGTNSLPNRSLPEDDDDDEDHEAYTKSQSDNVEEDEERESEEFNDESDNERKEPSYYFSESDLGNKDGLQIDNYAIPGSDLKSDPKKTETTNDDDEDELTTDYEVDHDYAIDDNDKENYDDDKENYDDDKDGDHENRRKYDAKDTSTENIDVKDVDAKDIDTKNVDMKDVGTKGIDTENMDAKDVGTKDMDTENMNAKDADTKDIDTERMNVKDVNAKNIDSENMGVKDIETEDIDTENMGIGDTDTENMNVKDVDTKDMDTESMDMKDDGTKGMDTENMDAEDVDTKSKEIRPHYNYRTAKREWYNKNSHESETKEFDAESRSRCEIKTERSYETKCKREKMMGNGRKGREGQEFAPSPENEPDSNENVEEKFEERKKHCGRKPEDKPKKRKTYCRKCRRCNNE